LRCSKPCPSLASNFSSFTSRRIGPRPAHTLHVRSQHDDALPLIVTHGWPGSIIEQLKIIEPLTNPTARGASASGAFHLVIPATPTAAVAGL
jgi:hypothetical protein